MKNKKLHYWHRNQNPFGGEERVLFANPPEKNDVVEAMPSAGSLLTGTPENREIARLTGTIVGNVTDVLNNKEYKKLAMKWDDLRKEMNALQNSIDHIKSYQNNLEANERSLDQVSFISRANLIFTQIKKLEDYATEGQLGEIKLNDEIKDITTRSAYEGAADVAGKNLLYEKAKIEINAIMTNIIEDFEKQKKDLDDQMKEILIDELYNFVKDEQKLWLEDPVIKKLVTTQSYDGSIQAINDYLAKVAEFKNDSSKVDTAKLLNDKDRFEDMFKDKRMHLIQLSKGEVDVDKLADRASKLKHKLEGHHGIAAYFGPIKSESEKLLTELDEAQSILESHKITIDKKDFERFQGKIDDVRKQLKDHVNIKENAEKLYNDDSYLFPKDPKEASEMPMGLVQQVEFVKNIKDPLRQKVYAELLEEAISKAEDQLNEKVFDDFYRKGIAEVHTNIQSFKNQFSEKKGDTSTKEIYFVSWYDCTRGWEIIKSWTENRMHRRSDMVIGKVGEKVIPNLNIPLTESLGGEFANKVHETEHHEVDRLAGLLKPHDIFHIRHMLHDVTNEDQLKAIIQVLCEKGAMRWDDPNILRLLNRFQKRIIFDESNGGENEFIDQPRFYTRLREATSAIWTPDDFRNWQSGNTSAYESGKQKFESVCNERAETGDGLKGFLKNMLKQVRMDPHHHKVDAMEYEQMIHYAIDKGKMAPEDRVYYIVQGMDCGLLDRKRGSELDSKTLNVYPVIEMFARSEGLTFEDIKALARIDSDQYAPGKAYNHHFQMELMHMKAVRERLEKTISQGNGIDHDDITSFAAHLEDKTIENLLHQKTSGFQLPATGVANCTVAMLNYLDMLSFSYDNIKDKERDLSRFLTVFLNFDNITRGRKYADRNNEYFRWGSSGVDTKVPRAAGGSLYRGGDYKKSAREYAEVVRGLISSVDPEFFKFVYDTKIPTDAEVVNFVKKLKSKYPEQNIFGDQQDPKKYDELLSVAGEYFNFMIKNDSTIATKLFAKVRADQVKADPKAPAEFETAWKKSQLRRGLQQFRSGQNSNVKLHELDPSFHLPEPGGHIHEPSWDEDPYPKGGHH